MMDNKDKSEHNYKERTIQYYPIIRQNTKSNDKHHSLDKSKKKSTEYENTIEMDR